MENRNTKQEQYEDAALTLLMDEHASQEGRSLLEAFAKAQETGEAPQWDAELESRCQKQMQKARRERSAKVCLSAVARLSSKVAVWAVVLICVISVTILAVDANGEVQKERFLENCCQLSDMEDRYIVHLRICYSRKEQDVDAVKQVMAGLEEQGYELALEYTCGAHLFGKNVRGIYNEYTNAQGNVVRLETRPPISGKIIRYKSNLEGYDVKEMRFLGYDMVMFQKGSVRELFWMDDMEALCYCLYADALSETDFWDLVYALAVD